MIKTKSRSCTGVNSKKHPQNIHAGYDYNPALEKFATFKFEARGFNFKFVSPN